MKVYIYALAHPLTGEIRYIGQTLNLNKRYREHLNIRQRPITHKISWIISLHKQNLKPNIIILAETDLENCDALEKYFIKSYTINGYRLTNMKEGGKLIPVTEETKKKISKSNMGRKSPMEGKRHPKERKERIRTSQPHAREVCQFSKNGDFIQIWDSASLAGEKLGLFRELISKTCYKKRQSHGGFRWCFIEDLIDYYGKTKTKE